jgi:hypothetical protein
MTILQSDTCPTSHTIGDKLFFPITTKNNPTQKEIASELVNHAPKYQISNSKIVK